MSLPPAPPADNRAAAVSTAVSPTEVDTGGPPADPKPEGDAEERPDPRERSLYAAVAECMVGLLMAGREFRYDEVRKRLPLGTIHRAVVDDLMAAGVVSEWHQGNRLMVVLNVGVDELLATWRKLRDDRRAAEGGGQ